MRAHSIDEKNWKMDEKDVHRDRWTCPELLERGCLCCRCRNGNSFLNRLRPGGRACYLTGPDCWHLSHYKTHIWVFKNSKEPVIACLSLHSTENPAITAKNAKTIDTGAKGCSPLLQCPSSTNWKWRRRLQNDGGFFRGYIFSKLKVMLSSSGLRKMQVWKACQKLDLVFLFLVSFIDCATGLLKQAATMRWHTVYWYLVTSITTYKSVEIPEIVKIGVQKPYEKKFKRLLKVLLDTIWETGPYWLNMHLLYHVVTAVSLLDVWKFLMDRVLGV